MSKKEITSMKDIQQMVDTFYDKVDQDDLLGPIFNDFAKVDWDSHLEIMYNFWGSMVFPEASYKGNPFNKHMPLPIESKHFDRWLELFLSNLDLQFFGDNADLFKERSKSIALIFDYKLKALKNED
jgi:hemoglobin